MIKLLTLSIFSFIYCVFSTQAADLAPWKARLMPESDAWRKTKQHFVFNNGSEPETLDPHLMTGSPEFRLAGALGEGLVSLDPETLTHRPGVAYQWQVSPNGLVYTFDLRKDAKWSDGKALTCADFVASWQRLLTQATGASYAYQLYSIKGAKDFYEGKIKDFSQVGIKAVTDQRLQVTLENPCAYFLDLCAFGTLFPVRTDLVKKHGQRWTQAQNFVGNGPFQLDAWLPRQHITMKKNPHYWDKDFVKLEKITVLAIDDADTAYKKFLKQSIHWLGSVPTPKIDEVRQHPDYYAAPFFGTYFYRFNVKKPPFDDARVRKAFCLATDKQAITTDILRAGQKPVGSFCPPIAGYVPPKGLSYNKIRARELLKAAGYGEGGKPFPVVEILYNTSESHKQIAEAIVQQWRQNLKVNISARNVEWKVFLSDMQQGNYSICRSSWIGDYGDPNTFLDLFITDGGNNRTGWSSKDYDKLLAQAQREPNKEKRYAIFQQMEKILVEDQCPILPIYLYVNQGMLSETVLGFYENIRGIHPLKYIWLEK